MLADAKIVVALWHPRGGVARANARLNAAGASRVVTTLDAAVVDLQVAA
jgi:hypothetical protein